MSAERLAAINEVVNSGIRAGGYPGASVFVGRQGYAVLEEGFGHLTWGRASAPVAPDRTIYDLASLTKVIATTTAIMVLYDEGKIGLDDPVTEIHPGVQGRPQGLASPSACCSSTASGLPPGRDLWRIAHSPAEAREQVIATPLYYRPDALLRVFRSRRRHARLRRRAGER